MQWVAVFEIDDDLEFVPGSLYLVLTSRLQSKRAPPKKITSDQQPWPLTAGMSHRYHCIPNNVRSFRVCAPRDLLIMHLLYPN